MPRILTSLFVLLLGAWPARPPTAGAVSSRRGARLRPRLPDADVQDPVEAPERARTGGAHQWPGQITFSRGGGRQVVRGQWRLTLERAGRTQSAQSAALALDPTYDEGWQTQLEELLTLQVPGARLRVVKANDQGWELLEVRAPTLPETVLQLDRAAVAQMFGSATAGVHIAFEIDSR